jgi:hypothetical protein
MRIKRKTLPMEIISLDELREKEDTGDERAGFEYKLGAYCEMDTESIGIRIDLLRLFKNNFFSSCEKNALTKKLGDHKLNTAERKAYQRAVDKLKNYYTKI